MSIEDAYLNPRNHSGYSGKYTPKEVRECLESSDVYTLHKPIRRTFAKNRYHVTNIDDLWQCGLIDVRSLKEYNDGYGYLLAAIDTFSKYAWVLRLKLKRGENLKSAFQKIFNKTKRNPINIQTDKGGEFTSSLVRKFFKENGMNYYVTQNPDVKASIVERFNRTLKTKIWRHFTDKNTRRYNHTTHSSIKMAPADVNEKNVYQVWKNLCGTLKNILSRPKLRVGEMVRISKNKSVFDEGYESNWTEEMFIIQRLWFMLWRIKEERRLKVNCMSQNCNVSVSTTRDYKIDKILGYRGKGLRREALVKWKGYPDNFNSWDQFYLTLPSNSSIFIHPDNTTTRFRTQPPRRIELKGEWEVSAVEFQYPCSVMTVGYGDNVIRMWTGLEADEKFHFTPGNYGNISTTVREINNINEISSRFVFAMNGKNQRVTVKPGPDLREDEEDMTYLTLSTKLALQLGFDPQQKVAVGSVP
ncbi:hypothetical protein J437_LFUL019350, partial [Ladona fulva]